MDKKRTKKDMTNITVLIPRKQRTELKIICLNKGYTIRDIFPKIIQEWIDKNK